MKRTITQAILVESCLSPLTADAFRAAFGRLVQKGSLIEGVDFEKKYRGVTFLTFDEAVNFIKVWNSSRSVPKGRKQPVQIDWEKVKCLAGIDGSEVQAAVVELLPTEVVPSEIEVVSDVSIDSDTIASLESAFAIVAQSTDPYPVNFDDAWQWLGYSKKYHAKKALEEAFEVDKDFSTGVLPRSRQNPCRDHQAPVGGRPSEQIKLTVECFQKFCMMAGTARGEQVRDYYLEVERKYRTLARRTSEVAIVNPSEEFMTRMVGTLDVLATEVSKMSQSLEEVKNQTSKLAAKNPKQFFKAPTKRAAKEILMMHNNGYCPLAEASREYITLVDPHTGQELEEIDYHHFDCQAFNNKLENCMPVSKAYHREFHNNALKMNWDEARVTWRKLVARYKHEKGLNQYTLPLPLGNY